HLPVERGRLDLGSWRGREHLVGGLRHREATLALEDRDLRVADGKLPDSIDAEELARVAAITAAAFTLLGRVDCGANGAADPEAGSRLRRAAPLHERRSFFRHESPPSRPPPQNLEQRGAYEPSPYS